MLIQILEARLPLRLPSESMTARSKLMERLENIIPGRDTGGLIAKEMLAFILGGWWRGTPTKHYPLGWRREKPNEQLKEPWSRVIPPLRSQAWQLLSGVDAFIKPLRWLFRREPATTFLSNFIGRIEYVPRPPWWDVSKVEVYVEKDSTENLSEQKGALGHDAVEFLRDDENTKENESVGTSSQLGNDDVEEAVSNKRILLGAIKRWLEQAHSSSPPRRGKVRACSVCGHPPGMHQCCSRCLKTAQGEDEIELLFGFRTIKGSDGSRLQIPQPWCRDCRGNKSNRSTTDP